jgi:hypothetical protein
LPEATRGNYVRFGDFTAVTQITVSWNEMWNLMLPSIHGRRASALKMEVAYFAETTTNIRLGSAASQIVTVSMKTKKVTRIRKVHRSY